LVLGTPYSPVVEKHHLNNQAFKLNIRNSPSLEGTKLWNDEKHATMIWNIAKSGISQVISDLSINIFMVCSCRSSGTGM